jgi:hypothetical protein
MRKIVFRAHADTVGTDLYRLEELDDSVTGKDLEDIATDIGHEHAQSYSPSTVEEEDYESYEEFYEAYLEQCGWWWEEYDPAKHDDYL